MNFISLGMLIYLQWYRPYLDHAINNIETFNEITVIILAYFLFCFTDFVPEPETRNDLGQYYYSITFLNIALHMFIIFKTSFLATRLKIRKRCHARRLQKMKKERQARL